MSIKEKLKEDLNLSLKSGDQLKRSLLGMVISSVRNREIEKRGKLSKLVTDPKELENRSMLNDDEVLEVISQEIKKRHESAQIFLSGNREELAKKEENEAAILMSYMPEQISEAELNSIIKLTADELKASSIKDMGKVIGSVMAKVKGRRADGSLVSKLVKIILDNRSNFDPS